MKQPDKKITTIYVNSEILNFCKKNKLSLSEWVNTEFIDKFFGLRTKIKELESIKRQEEKLKQEIQAIKDRRKELSHSLTTRERQYLDNVMSKIKKGFDLVHIFNYFNNEFKRDFSFEEFKELVELNELQAKSRLRYVLLEKEKAKEKRMKSILYKK